MATVFMKWLETSPADYDRGIQLITLGRHGRLLEWIALECIGRLGMRVLEIGCGTGTLTRRLAERGATVTAIDASEIMLSVAETKVATAGLADRVTFIHQDATTAVDLFEPGTFDLVVTTLLFSELPVQQQIHILKGCVELLASGGRILVADEVVPRGRLRRVLFYLVRFPILLVTWVLTRTTTHALRDFEATLAASGLTGRKLTSLLGGTLVLYEARVASEAPETSPLPIAVTGRLSHTVSLRTILIDLWSLFFRIIPPYPKQAPGLYAVGHPDEHAPVLVTGNFDVTVRRVVRALDGRLDVWLLVVDSAGINVWCAAGGHYLTAEKVIAAVKSTNLDEIVRHRALILPQLCANGVNGWSVRKGTGWGVHWGPIRAEDIPTYISSKRKKSESMRWVRFPLRDRLEMVMVTLGFYGLLILLPFLLFWRPLFWPVAASLVGLSLFYAVAHPWLPGRDGLLKSIPLTLIALLGLMAYSIFWHPLSLQRLFNWVVGLTGLSVFTGAELQGMSPIMRGEQANWRWEALIGVLLALVYWLVPLAVGWK